MGWEYKQTSIPDTQLRRTLCDHTDGQRNDEGCDEGEERIIHDIILPKGNLKKDTVYIP